MRQRYSTADLGAALAHAHAFGAFDCRAIERILAAGAAPRRLAEYVAEQTAKKLDELPDDRDTFLCALDEYDRLPTVAEAPPCPDTSSQAPTRASNDADDTSTSSD